MEFVLLRGVCEENGVSMPDFAFLNPDSSLYRCILFQPAGNLFVSNAGILNDEEDHVRKFSAFLKLVRDQQADLAVCPEYSCPWTAIESAIEAGHVPGPGRLWILGTQSITPSALAAIEERLPEVSFVFDRSTVESASIGNFVDPVCFVFQDTAGKLVIAVQFKQQHMGVGHDPIERNCLIRGSVAYVIRNEDDSVSLAVLICSDALDFQLQKLPEVTECSYLIIHIQLNANPRNQPFASYRSALFDRSPENKEIVCLNWAAGTQLTMDDTRFPLVEFPHSAIYTKSCDVNLTDDRLLHNHANGLFYFRWDEKRAHVFVAGSGEHCFEYISTKPSQADSSPAACSRTGPCGEAAYCWDGEHWVSVDEVPDGSEEMLDQNQLLGRNPLVQLNKIQQERFVCLCCGDVKGTKWESPTNLASFQIDAQEILARTTFCHDALGLEAINERLAKVKTLLDIFESNINFSACCAGDLAGSRVHYEGDSPHFNVYKGDSAYGTAAYIGPTSNPAQVDRKLGRLFKALSRTGYVRIFVWHHDGTELCCRSECQSPTFADVPGDPTAINGARRI